MAINGANSYPGNAKVSPSAWIQPPQAFVNAITNLAGYNAYATNLGSQGITSITEDVILTVGNTANETELFTFNLSLNNNALVLDCVNQILSWCRNDGFSNGTLDLSGGTNAPPTPEQPHIDEIDTYQFVSPANDGDQLVVYSNPSSANYWVVFTNFDATIPLSSSSVSGNGNEFTIDFGIQDNPSASDMANAWVSLITEIINNENPIADSLSVNNDTVTWRQTTDGNLPFGNEGCSSCNANIVQSGQNFEPNNNLANLITDGWTVTTN